MPRIAIIGAGSMVFSNNLISDILCFDSLKDTTFTLMDIDRERLAVVKAMAESINRTRGTNAKIITTRDRKAALDGADYVVNTIGVGGFKATKTDLLVPRKFGLRQTIGDTLGIGGIFRALRGVPVVLEMCAEMEKVCPDALLLSYSNPMAMHCLAIQRGSRVKSVGLCHGVRYTRGHITALARIAQMRPSERKAYTEGWTPLWNGPKRLLELIHECCFDDKVRTLVAGINHVAAFLKFEDEKGNNLYPWLFKAAETPELFRMERVRLEMMKCFGYFFTETCDHLAEYLPWFLKDEGEIKRLNIRPNCYLGTCENLDRTFREYKRKARTGEPFIRPDRPISIEYASRVLNAIETNVPYVFNGNVNNAGGSLIENLPGDSCVEVPCVADARGVSPTRVGRLPAQCAALMRTSINVQDLVVQAILERRRDHVYHAAMLDPNTSATLTIPRIYELVDAMFAAHGNLMPRYLRK